MNIRMLSGAFLINGNDYLMMKRADTKKVAPGMWSGVGGHMDPNEINNPKETCLREIYEETGIIEKDIKKIDLKYIVIRRDKVEITLLYYFIGFLSKRDYKDKTNEGKLYWVKDSELLNRDLSFELRKIIEHYIEKGHISPEISVGVVSLIKNEPVINWHSLDGWEGITGKEILL